MLMAVDMAGDSLSEWGRGLPYMYTSTALELHISWMGQQKQYVLARSVVAHANARGAVVHCPHRVTEKHMHTTAGTWRQKSMLRTRLKPINTTESGFEN
jgi:hypothetical protein